MNFSTSELAGISDVITIEIEHVNTAPLLEMESSGRVVHPSSSTIQLIQVFYSFSSTSLMLKRSSYCLPPFYLNRINILKRYICDQMASL